MSWILGDQKLFHATAEALLWYSTVVFDTNGVAASRLVACLNEPACPERAPSNAETKMLGEKIPCVALKLGVGYD